MICSIDTCNRHVFAGKMCSMHYQRVKKHGNPNTLLGRSGMPQFSMPTDELRQLYEEADSISSLSRQLGVPQQTLNYQLIVRGIPVRDRGWHSPKTTPPRTMEDSPNWKGGRYQTGKGYIMIYGPDHPSHTSKGYVAEHRLVVEKEIGRLLLRTEYVHHLNGIRDDNRPENLELWQRKDPTGIRKNQLPHCATCTCS